ncbi:hypothetical protein L195_g035321, partial [Trifolium pratense]
RIRVKVLPLQRSAGFSSQYLPNLGSLKFLGLWSHNQWLFKWINFCISLSIGKNNRCCGVLPFRPWEEVQRRYYLYAHVSNINMVAKSGGKAMKHIKWQAPSVGWIHLNTDGVAKVGVIAGF